ncbi:MAG: outer membrane lipoprotein carrier protein LolA [Planctomycetes bacterium]|nr:outer membrane lipoprotein carrier protein LolA [Planctomycetota bacterium]
MRHWILALLMLAAIAPLAIAQDAPKPKEDAPTKAKDDDKEDEKPESLDDLLKRIEKEHKEHKDFKGNFDQTKFLPLFGDEIKSNGKFVFKKPDHVRWEYTKPHKSILVVTGDSGKKWSESTNRVENFKLGDDRGLDAVVKQLFTWFKGEFTKLKDDYTVTIEERSPAKLKMVPKKELVKKFIASIEVKFAKEEKQIASVQINEPIAEGDEKAGYTLYEFKDTKLDSDVKDSEFKIDK